MDNKDEAGGNIFLRQDSELVREAEGRFREAIRAHPHHVHAHYNLAIIHMWVDGTAKLSYLQI